MTKDCFYADGRRGVVRIYLRDKKNRMYEFENTGCAATAELRGRVQWRSK